MLNQTNPIGLQTILRKEIIRFLRIWPQTLLPSMITTTLYFFIFGSFMGQRIGTMNGIPYIEYIAPGLIMMAVISNTYGNVVGSFYGARFQKSIEEMLVSPLPNGIILLGFIGGGVLRGLAVALGVSVITLYFTHLRVEHLLVTIMTILMTSTLFSLAGMLNAIFARNFDDISIIPTFVLTPLTYLGGIFYSIDLLSPFWQHLSHANPIFYIVNNFRFGILGLSDVPVMHGFILLTGFILLLTWINLKLLNQGTGIRN